MIRWSPPCGCKVDVRADWSAMINLAPCAIHAGATLDVLRQWCADNQPQEVVE
jgi:hypothetical protein